MTVEVERTESVLLTLEPGAPNAQVTIVADEGEPQENGGCGPVFRQKAGSLQPSTNDACALGSQGEEPERAGGMVPEEISGQGARKSAHETLPALSTPHVSKRAAAAYARRKQLWDDWQKLKGKGLSRKEAASELGVNDSTLWRLLRSVTTQGKKAFEDKRRRSGRRPKYRPTQGEIECVREIYAKLDESEARGRGLGSSKVTAFRLAAKSDDTRIGEEFRRVVLQRKHKTLPPTFEDLLDTPASVLERGRDQRSTMSAYISTPRGRTWVDESGKELPLRAGTICEADDGTFNFYAWIPWPFGGDKCSDKFGVKLGRWQLLAVVDARWEFCCAFDVVARNLSSYRAEDAGALLGRTMAEVCVPEVWRLERGSWESKFVREALDLCRVPVVNAWHSKQKNAVERFFDRFWTPASLIPGHIGRDRGRFKDATDLALACQDGRRDPREHFLPLSGGTDSAIPRVIAAIKFVNGEPIESKAWGSWVPQERFEAQLREDGRQQLDPALRIFFSREQREWTVRGAYVGGNVECPLIRFPIYFQCAELWEFEGCRVKCYFDPYAEPVLGTLVLQDEWRSCKPGHVIARDVPAVDLPPQVVLATEGWADKENHERSIAIRKAIAKAVRTESWNWLGNRSAEVRDGLGNIAKRETGASSPAGTMPSRGQAPAVAVQQPGKRGSIIQMPTAEEVQRRRNRLEKQAQNARQFTPVTRRDD